MLPYHPGASQLTSTAQAAAEVVGETVSVPLSGFITPNNRQAEEAGRQSLLVELVLHQSVAVRFK